MKKFTNRGSSETIRETDLERFCFQQYIANGTPIHRPNPDIEFLEWFIGFFEAEGSFTHWVDKRSNRIRFAIEVTQKDPKLLFKIRTKLGFGKVIVFSRDGKGPYARYYIGDKKNLERMIYLFNGQFITERKRMQFHSWLAKLNHQRCNDSKTTYAVSYSTKNKVSFKTAWLAGFLEGDGGFWVSSKSILYLKKNGEQSFRLKMKFYVTQEYSDVLIQIANCFGKNSPKLHQLSNGQTSKFYFRFETSRLEDHLQLSSYLTTYKFLGKRSITLKRWLRLLNYRIYKYPVTEKSVKKVIRLIQATKN